MTCDCHSYNGDFGERPEVILPAPSWADQYRNGNTIPVDACIADTVTHLWENEVITLGSCCGHGKREPSLVLNEDPWDVADVLDIIAQVDDRTWKLHQWQLVDLTLERGETDE